MVPVLLILAISIDAVSSGHMYCVFAQNETQSCPPQCEVCHTLGYYSKHVDQYFSSNTTILFLPGIHTLENNTTTLINDVNQLELMGNSSGDVGSTIQCEGAGSFFFTNSSNIQIRNLTFINCGQNFPFDISILCNSCRAALAFDTVDTLLISGVTVNCSNGWGVFAKRVYGTVSVLDSMFASNYGTREHDGGNTAFIYRDCVGDHKDAYIQLQDLEILNGYSDHKLPVSPGLSLVLECSGINASIVRVKTVGNIANNTRSTGGNIAIIYRNYTSLVRNRVTIDNCYIAKGIAYQGGGMFVSILEAFPTFMPVNLTEGFSQVLRVSNTQFIDNLALSFAGGLFIIVHEMPNVFEVSGELSFRNCTFLNNRNSVKVSWVGGTTVHINNHDVPSYLSHGTPQFNISFTGCNFSGNFLHSQNCYGSSTVFAINVQSGVYFTDCIFEDNACTALLAVQSIFILHGNITIQRNSGSDGGGLVFCDQSYMYLTPYTDVTFHSNNANHSGGAIYSEEECLQSIPLCFFQLDESIIINDTLLSTVHIRLVNNTAGYAGSALYGGSVDFCYIPGVGPHLFPLPAIDVFHEIFEIEHPDSDFSFISSNPSDMCFCDSKTMVPNCNIATHNVSIFPGEMFNISVVVVGQMNGTVPGTITAKASTAASLGDLQNVQAISSTKCSVLNYTLSSNSSSETISLQIQRPDYTSDIYFHPTQRLISVSLKECPPGFKKDHNPSYCDCAPLYKNKKIKCYINEQRIHRSSPVWIGYGALDVNTNHQTNRLQVEKLMFHDHCPFDFCVQDAVNITVSNLTMDIDSQCSPSRTGVLCGACMDGFSLALGTSSCIRCSNYWMFLLVFFAVAGVALVFLLVTCNLTVAHGTINGLVFYANIVQINRAIFFPPNFPFLNHFLHVFISWINLDLGIQTCFYNGLDSHIKTWLQFAFPLYIWVIAALIIYLSEKYTAVASLVGKNAVKVLATLFLLSYAKLLRAVMTTISLTFLSFSDNSKQAVWLHDANIPYFHAKRIPLLIVAFLFGLCTLPYVLSILFVQFLQRNTHLRIFSWVLKLKPFLDAYAGPYKDKYRFWTGWLLVLRFCLFAVFELNVLGAPDVNLLTIALACMCILPPLYSGVYRSWPLNVLELSFILNLGVLSLATMYCLNNGGNQNAVASTSTTIAFVTFLGIIVWHAYKESTLFKCIRKKTGNNEPINEVVETDKEDMEYREPLLAHQDT